MPPSNSPTLLVVGCGSGIGTSTASLFASRKFGKVALISRDSVRIQHDRQQILDVAKAAGKEVDVETWSVDITNTPAFQKVLHEVEKFGAISCVLFNAARVDMSELFVFEEKEIIYDFMTTNIALYTTAAWALPILVKEPDSPSFFVTSSLLWADPIPQMFSLSMVKAGQRNLVLSMQKMYPGVHIALLNIGGQVTKEHKYFNPGAIAEKFWELYSQEKGAWVGDMNLLGE